MSRFTVPHRVSEVVKILEAYPTDFPVFVLNPDRVRVNPVYTGFAHPSLFLGSEGVGEVGVILSQQRICPAGYPLIDIGRVENLKGTLLSFPSDAIVLLAHAGGVDHSVNVYSDRVKMPNGYGVINGAITGERDFDFSQRSNAVFISHRNIIENMRK